MTRPGTGLVGVETTRKSSELDSPHAETPYELFHPVLFGLDKAQAKEVETGDEKIDDGEYFFMAAQTPKDMWERPQSLSKE